MRLTSRQAGDIYKCICNSKPRKRRKGSRYSNLHSHINAKHPNWTTEILTDQSNLTGVNRDGENMFSWIKWIIQLIVHVS